MDVGHEPKLFVPEGCENDPAPVLPNDRTKTGAWQARTPLTRKRWVSGAYYAHEGVPIAPFGVGFPRPIVYAPSPKVSAYINHVSRWPAWVVVHGKAPGVYTHR